jgi:hypothetical protein
LAELFKKKIMKKIVIAVLTMSCWLAAGCHREGLDNNMNDAYEQPAKCPAPVPPGKYHVGESNADTTSNSKSYSDSSNHHK